MTLDGRRLVEAWYFSIVVDRSREMVSQPDFRVKESCYKYSFKPEEPIVETEGRYVEVHQAVWKSI